MQFLRQIQNFGIFLDQDIAKDLYNQCAAIRRMPIASVNTAKEKANDCKNDIVLLDNGVDKIVQQKSKKNS